ncbi:hypothetical protein [Fodinicola feengrottensis]|uniref:hypothetical protein n=1 Tax=Fodinicola feengrottensis TaxID=435914 RepID=UPI0013D23D92|nr:hypothetical protein [Fodinicola feengrottensis]
MRSLTRCAVAVLTIAILGGSVPIVASSPAYAADPTLTIVTAEQKDFANGDTITVAGANFPANTRVELGQCVGTRGYPHGERLWDTETVNAHPYRKKALYCSAGAPTNKQGIGTPYVATTAADGTLLARLVLFRGNGSFPLTSTDGTGTTTVTPAFDAQHPAVLVARNAVTSAITGNIVYASAALTFAPDGTSVCGAGDKDTAVASGGSGSTSVYLSLVTGMCGTGGKGLPVDATESGEVTALQAFQSGQSDLAFSATGFTPPGAQRSAGPAKQSSSRSLCRPRPSLSRGTPGLAPTRTSATARSAKSRQRRPSWRTSCAVVPSFRRKARSLPLL